MCTTLLRAGFLHFSMDFFYFTNQKLKNFYFEKDSCWRRQAAETWRQTCVVTSQPSSRLTMTDEPVSRSSTTRTDTCSTLWSYTHTHVRSVLTSCYQVRRWYRLTDQRHPLRVLQAAQEAHVGVSGGWARHARLHQLFETVLHLSHVTHLDGHHLPLLEGVLLPSLRTTNEVRTGVRMRSVTWTR